MNNLNPKQAQLIPLIIELGNIDKACKQANIDRSTYYLWLKDENFVAELKKQQDTMYDNALICLKNSFGGAVNTLNELLESNDENLNFKAANAIIINFLKLIEKK